MEKRKCLHCQKDFKPARAKQVYCSTKCRTYAFRERGIITGELPVFNGAPITPAHPTPHKSDPFPVLQVKIKPAMPKGLSLSDQIKWKIDNLQ